MDTKSIVIATGLAGLVTGAIWCLLMFRNQRRKISFRALLLLIIVAGLLCRVGYALLTPAFYAPDEKAHFSYIKFLAERHAFPIMPSKPDESNGEYCQSPLYYLAMVPFYKMAHAMFPNPSTIVGCLRLFSIALWLLNVWLGSVLLKRLQVKDDFVWILVMSVVSLLPTYTITSAAINNDNLLLAFSTGLLCLLTCSGLTLRQSILLGLMLGFALYAKQSAGVFIPVIAFRTIQVCSRQRIRWPLGLAYFGITMGIAAIMYSPWALRSLQVYGSFTPELLAAPHRIWPSMAYGLASAVHNLIKTFWAVAGITNNIGYPFPLAGMLLLAVALVIPFAFLGQESRLEPMLPEDKKPMLTIFLIAMTINALLALRFGYLLGMGQGRHLFPVLYPFAILMAARLRFLPLKNLDVHTVGFWTTYAFTFAVFSLCRFP